MLPPPPRASFPSLAKRRDPEDMHPRTIPPYLSVLECAVFLCAAGLIWLAIPSVPQMVNDLLSGGDINNARDVLGRAGGPATAENERLQSRISVQLGDIPGALKHAKNATSLEPDQLEAIVYLADLQYAFCRPDDAMKTLESAFQVYRRWRAADRPQLVRMARGNVQPGGTVLPTRAELVRRIDTWFLRPLHLLANLTRWYQRFDRAIEVQKELAALAPEDPTHWTTLAWVEGCAGHRAEARTALARAVAVGKALSDLRLQLAERYQWAGKPDMALDEILKAKTPLRETRERALEGFVSVCHPEEGLAEYRRKNPSDRDDRAIRLVLIDLLSQTADRSKALAFARDAARTYPEDRETLEALLELEISARHLREVHMIAGQLVKLEPSDPAILRLAFNAATDVEDKPGALALAQALQSALGPEEKLDRDIGVKLAQFDFFQQAEPILEDAVKADETDELALFLLSRARSVRGDHDGSIRLLKQLELLRTPAATPAVHQTPSSGETSVPRRILVLYKRTEGDRTDANMVHDNLEIILNHLGLIVDYRAVEDPLPEEVNRHDYCGILTWYRSEAMPNAESYANWIAHQAESGVRVVTFEKLGCWRETAGGANAPAAMARLCLALGMSVGGGWTDEPGMVEIRHEDKAMCSFERRIAPEANFYTAVRCTDPQARSHLVIARRSHPSETADAIFTGPRGGFCLASYAVHSDPEGFRYQWRLNPFAFLERSLGLGGEPRLDFTTRDGARMVFLHADGDGSEQLLEDRPDTTCTASLLHDVIQRRPYLFTVSFIAKLLDTSLNVPAWMQTQARSVFAHPRVEAGHHSYSHPMHWERLSGNRKALSAEITHAARVLERDVCPPDKKVKVCLWSGQANPDHVALSVTKESGQLNLNGGGARMSPNDPSLLYLCPPHRSIGGLIQNLTPAQDDFGATLNLTLPAVAFSNVVHTFENTESPRRLLPVDVYFHFYTLATPGARQGLTALLDWVETRQLHSVWVSEYLQNTADFRRGQITQLAADTWRISRFGSCRTVRFDRAGEPDLSDCTGVLGWNRANGSLYVHLDGNQESKIRLRVGLAAQPHLEMSTLPIKTVRHTPGALEIDIEPRPYPGHLVASGLRTGTYRVTVPPGTQHTTIPLHMERK
jgi:tetratricopeptide (TPR) repeat protein